jgi:hypothetical protein
MTVPYYPPVSGDLWIGAAATLGGAALGGAISFVVSRQQLRDAREQRAEDAAREDRRRNADRRFAAYAEFNARVRQFRNALRPYGYQPVPRLSMDEISALARAAHDASSAVFLIAGNPRTVEACRKLVAAMSRAQGVIDDTGSAPSDKPWPELNETIASAVRSFEEAARDELEIS